MLCYRLTISSCLKWLQMAEELATSADSMAGGCGTFITSKLVINTQSFGVRGHLLSLSGCFTLAVIRDGEGHLGQMIPRDLIAGRTLNVEERLVRNGRCGRFLAGGSMDVRKPRRCWK